MQTELNFFPESASTMSGSVDALYLFLVGLAFFLTVVIAALILIFSIQYRAGSKAPRPPLKYGFWIEVSWVIFPIPILLLLFFWGAYLYFQMHRPPVDALEMTAVGKQWMWKFQHPNGRSEIDHLHVPVGRPVRLTMISQDVIHSLYFPAFRVKQDVLPGRYTYLWFEATKPGTYHLFCAEYCGTHHSLMKGMIHVMSPADYQEWLAGGEERVVPPELTGQKLYEQFRCGSCHLPQNGKPARAPSLANLFAQPVPLSDGTTKIADESYIRQSILEPNEDVVAGYQSIMPTFEGQISEEGILQLTAYIKSLGRTPAAQANGPQAETDAETNESPSETGAPQTQADEQSTETEGVEQ
jgi:cytochrome c oxidase subunit 2